VRGQLHCCSEATIIDTEETKMEAKEWMQKHAQMTTNSEEWKDEYSRMVWMYNVLLENVGELVEENGKLLVRCRQPEESNTSRTEECAEVFHLREERDALRQALEEATQITSERQVALAQQESAKALETLKRENDILSTQFEAA